MTRPPCASRRPVPQILEELHFDHLPQQLVLIPPPPHNMSIKFVPCKNTMVLPTEDIHKEEIDYMKLLP